MRALICDKLKAMGFSMVQRSVYIARGGSSKAKDVARALQRYVDSSRDSILITIVPHEVLEKAVVIGVNRVKSSEHSYAVV